MSSRARSRAIPDKGAELVTSDAGAFVRKLKSQPGKDIIVMSGGNFADFAAARPA